MNNDISNLWQAIGQYSAQVASTGELAPPQYLVDAVKNIETHTNNEIVSCMFMGEKPYVIAVTKDGRAFIGYVRTGDRPEVEWKRVSDIPLHISSTE